MSTRRDFGPIASLMREALDKYSRDELADLLTHIVRLYVIEAKDEVVTESVAPRPGMNLAGLSFAQLVLHLQMNLDHPELQHLKVSGDRVWAERNGTEIVLTGDADLDAEGPPDPHVIAPNNERTVPAPAATGPVFPTRLEIELRPGDPGYNRRQNEAASPASVARDAGQVQRPSVALDEERATPRQPPTAWTDRALPPRPNRTATTPPPAALKKSKKDDDDDIGDVSDRFSMLELD